MFLCQETKETKEMQNIKPKVLNFSISTFYILQADNIEKKVWIKRWINSVVGLGSSRKAIQMSTLKVNFNITKHNLYGSIMKKICINEIDHEIFTLGNNHSSLD